LGFLGFWVFCAFGVTLSVLRIFGNFEVFGVGIIQFLGVFGRIIGVGYVGSRFLWEFRVFWDLGCFSVFWCFLGI